ncbi:hypothetical protein ACMYSQ_010826 [Aspergillus niger]
MESSVHHISTSSKVLLKKARNLVPPMLEKFHKGQQGRVAVIGGSIEYVHPALCSCGTESERVQVTQGLHTFLQWRRLDWDAIW